MNKNEKIELIKQLSEANGASGFEDEVAQLLRGFCQDYGELKEDSLRNVYVERKANTGKRPRVMLDAHSDEVGFIVQTILPNGLLKILPLGSWSPTHVPAQRVRVKSVSGAYIPGVIATKPVHYLRDNERNALPQIEDMMVDIGAASKQEAEELFGVRLAAPIVPDVPFVPMAKDDYFLGKAFDCRIGCAAQVATLNALQEEELSVDVCAVFSTQEEVGGRGAEVSSLTVKPDLCIVFEGTPADDSFGSPDTMQTVLGKGPMLRHMDRTMITNPRFQRFCLDLAADQGLAVQEAVRTGGGTNGGIIHRTNAGVPCVVIGVPVRYVHSHNGIICYRDFEAATALAAAVLWKLDAEVIASF